MTVRSWNHAAMVILICSLFLSTKFAQCQQFNPSAPDPKQFDTSGPYQRPAEMNGDLSYLGLRGFEKGLTKAQWTEVVLNWLMAERANPAQETTGLGGGPIDTLYIQAQIWKTLEGKGDPLLINWLIASPGLKNKEIKTGLRLVLGAMGDERQLPLIRDVLVHDPNPNFRSLAAEDLAVLNDQKSVPLLQQALKDPFFVVFGQVTLGPHSAGEAFYPVRVTVRGCLGHLRRLTELVRSDPKTFAELTQEITQFRKLLPHASDYARHANNLASVLAVVSQ